MTWATGAPSTAKLAEAKLGGPNIRRGLREKPMPSFGMPAKVSSLELPFSSWITATT